MPIYKMLCAVCGFVEDDVFLKAWNEEHRCEKCNAPMGKVPSIVSPHVFPADGIFLEHVSSTGKRFFSKKEMKDYARKNDLEIGYIE